MTTGRLIDVQSFSTAQTTGQLFDVATVNTPIVGTGQVLNVTSVNLPAGTSGQVLNATSLGIALPQASLSGPAYADPLDLVVLDASSSVGTVTGITQVAGTPTVTLAGTGASRTFTAPVLQVSAGTVTPLTFQAAVTSGGTANWVVNVYPHGEWVLDSGLNFVPRLRFGRDPATLLPRGPVTGWGAQVYAQDFTTPIGVGGFVTDTAGNLSNLAGGNAGYQAYGSTFQASAQAVNALSVTVDGYLDIWLRLLPTASAVTTTQIIPAIPAMTYGRYAVRFRAISVLPGWSASLGLLPVDLVLPDHGQVDYPSGDLSDDDLVMFTPAIPAGIPAGVSSGSSWADWHIAVIELKPSSLKCYLDGALIYTATANVPGTPMAYSIRTSGLSSTDAHLQIDWIGAWSI